MAAVQKKGGGGSSELESNLIELSRSILNTGDALVKFRKGGSILSAEDREQMLQKRLEDYRAAAEKQMVRSKEQVLSNREELAKQRKNLAKQRREAANEAGKVRKVAAKKQELEGKASSKQRMDAEKNRRAVAEQYRRDARNRREGAKWFENEWPLTNVDNYVKKAIHADWLRDKGQRLRADLAEFSKHLRRLPVDTLPPRGAAMEKERGKHFCLQSALLVVEAFGRAALDQTIDHYFKETPFADDRFEEFKPVGMLQHAAVEIRELAQGKREPKKDEKALPKLSRKHKQVLEALREFGAYGALNSEILVPGCAGRTMQRYLDLLRRHKLVELVSGHRRWRVIGQ